jgi:soluble lytic murein transglycosylase-like protein
MSIAMLWQRLALCVSATAGSALAGIVLGLCATAAAGSQIYEPLSAATRSTLQRAVADQAVNGTSFHSQAQAQHWVTAMSERLRGRFADPVARIDFLRTVHYEASRAGLDPQLVLAVIQVESNFRKYAVSTAGARGFMQVMPFWVDVIGTRDHNLFHLRTNLRYGCLILRHYLDIERGNLTRALGRYNGSLGQLWYPTMVQNAWKSFWQYAEAPSPNAVSSSHTVEIRY